MAFNNEIEELKGQIKVLEKKLALLEEVEKQPRMNLQQEGEYAVVSYHDKVYYRLMGETTFSWYIKKGVSVDYPVPTLVMVNDAETERLLEGIYYNHIVVKKETAQERGERVHNEMEETIRIHDGYGVVDYKPTPKTPVEEAYKDWWGEYPGDENWTSDATRWQGFQAGYNSAYEEKVAQEPEENEWKSVALRFGEKLSGYLSDGYYELSPNAWFRWAVFTYGKGQQIKETVRESVRWCEDHPDKDPLDCLKPQTPEQVADGLKEAFKEAVKQGVVSSVEKPKDDFMDKMVAELKGQNLTDLIYDWWEDVFTTHSDWDMETSIADLVDQIEQWLPKSQSAAGSQNAYVECTVEGFNDCLNKIKRKLR